MTHPKHTLGGEPQDGGESLESFHSRFYELRLPDDIKFVKGILPRHYSVTEGGKRGSIHCKSSIGIRLSPYKNSSTGNMVTDAEDEEMWGYIFKAIKKHFGERFQEVFHNTCFCHVDFMIYFKPEP